MPSSGNKTNDNDNNSDNNSDNNNDDDRGGVAKNSQVIIISDDDDNGSEKKIISGDAFGTATTTTTISGGNLIDLPNLHEADLLRNLRQRSQWWCTRAVGVTKTQENEYDMNNNDDEKDIIVVVDNPKEWIHAHQHKHKHLLTANEKDTTRPQCIITEICNNSLKDMIETKCNQSIVIHGESGSGKTKSFNILLDHIITKTSATTTTSFNDVQQQKRIYEASQVILQAFGNASTSGNGSASRFGQYIQMEFLHNKNNNVPVEAVTSTTDSNGDDDDDRHKSGIEEDNDSDDNEQGLTLSLWSRLLSSLFKSQKRKEEKEEVLPKQIQRPAMAVELVGSKIHAFMLETLRVTSSSSNDAFDDDERNYHIFDYLLAAPKDKKKEIWEDGLLVSEEEANDGRVSTFAYLAGRKKAVSSLSDLHAVAGFDQVVEALKVMGISDGSCLTIFRTLCIILQFGNITFQPKQLSDDRCDNERCEIGSHEEFDKLCKLLGFSSSSSVGEKDDDDDDRTKLEHALTNRLFRTRPESYWVPLKCDNAKEFVDAFAQELYLTLFRWLVSKINDMTCTEHDYSFVGLYGSNSDGDDDHGDEAAGSGSGGERNSNFITMLDLPGFESNRNNENRFYQLCTNYCDEKLQYLFNQNTGLLLQQQHDDEDDRFLIPYDDNSDVLELIEGKVGMLALLKEECIRPRGSASTYMCTTPPLHKKSPCLFVDKKNRLQFGIYQTKGSVIYDTEKDFVVKDTYQLSKDIRDALKNCNNEIITKYMDKNNDDENVIRNTFSSIAKESKKKPQRRIPKRARRHLLHQDYRFQFQSQLASIMKELNEETKISHVLCIKPNDKVDDCSEHSLEFDERSVLRQIRSSNLLPAIKMQKWRLEEKNSLRRMNNESLVEE